MTEVGGGGAGVAGGNEGVGDGDDYGIGGHGNGEDSDSDDHVGGDSGSSIDDGCTCNGGCGGVGGGHLNKGDDKGRNGARRSENSNGNGKAVELDSDHELVAAEDYSCFGFTSD